MAPGGDRELFWKGLTGRLKRRIRRKRTTLVFATSRRMVAHLAWSHHGSPSREVRAVVEELLDLSRAPRGARGEV